MLSQGFTQLKMTEPLRYALFMTQRLSDIGRFYQLLGLLEQTIGGSRTLASATGKLVWPKRGVYFFFEDGETRSDSGTGPRIVRIGTHALNKGSSTTVWGRLRGHRGSVHPSGGNHRGSIFRLIVGTALMERDGDVCPTWDDRRANAPREVRDAERTMEAKVSEAICAMPFVWLPVDDEAGPQSERGIIERGSISLLSNWNRKPIDPPSSDWLGRRCSRERIRQSGLWNSNHVDEIYDPVFLDRFHRLVDAAGQHE